MPTDEWERGYSAGYDRAVRNYINADANEDWSPIDTVIQHAPKSPNPKKKRTRTKTKRDGKMSRALKTVNKRAKKKNGDFKKGWDQSRVMKEAHKLARR